jgi:hypothetical protein
MHSTAAGCASASNYILGEAKACAAASLSSGCTSFAISNMATLQTMSAIRCSAQCSANKATTESKTDIILSTEIKNSDFTTPASCGPASEINFSQVVTVNLKMLVKFDSDFVQKSTTSVLNAVQQDMQKIVDASSEGIGTSNNVVSASNTDVKNFFLSKNSQILDSTQAAVTTYTTNIRMNQKFDNNRFSACKMDFSQKSIVDEATNIMFATIMDQTVNESITNKAISSILEEIKIKSVGVDVTKGANAKAADIGLIVGISITVVLVVGCVVAYFKYNKNKAKVRSTSSNTKLKQSQSFKISQPSTTPLPRSRSVTTPKRTAQQTFRGGK